MIFMFTIVNKDQEIFFLFSTFETFLKIKIQEIFLTFQLLRPQYYMRLLVEDLQFWITQVK